MASNNFTSLSWLIVVVAVLIALDHFDNRPVSADNSAETLCTQQIAELQDDLFPKNWWIEKEVWLLSILQTLNISAPGMENDVSKYEDGRMLAERIALQHYANSPFCKDN